MTDEDFELMFLGHVLERREHALEARSVVDGEAHFTNPGHAAAWATLWALADEHRVFSPADWCDRLYRAGCDDAVAIVHRARALGEEPAAPMMREAREIVRRADVRAQIGIHVEAVKRLRSGRDDADRVREEVIGQLASQRGEARKHFYDGPEVARRLEAELDARAKNTGEVVGFTTGIDALDSMSGGMQRGRLIVLGSRAGVGKTSFALQLAGSVMDRGGHAMIMSFEMDAEDLAMRMLAQMAKIPTSIVERGRLTSEQSHAATQLYARLVSTKSSWVDTPTLTIDQIIGRATSIHAVRPLSLVVVDYLQLVAGKGKSYGNRNLEVAEISRALKELSRRLGVTVLALSQLNRKSEDGDEMKLPQLSDLRDSGAIEQDADQVWLLHRRRRDSTDAELHFAKNRRGKTGVIKLSFDGECTSYGNHNAALRVVGKTPGSMFDDLAGSTK